MLKNFTVRETRNNNDVAKWIIIILALATLVFNTGVLYNDVKHLKEDNINIMREITEIKRILIKEK